MQLLQQYSSSNTADMC